MAAPKPFDANTLLAGFMADVGAGKKPTQPFIEKKEDGSLLDLGPSD